MLSNTKIVLISCAGLVAIGIAAALIFTSITNSYKKQIINLQNEVAKRDQTIEVSKDVFTRLTAISDTALNQLDASKAENAALQKQLKDTKAQVLSAQAVAIKWKKAYEASVKGTQTEEAGRKKVSFNKDFGYIIAEGWTLTDPPEAFIRVKQGRPLKLSLVMTQSPDKSWRSYVTSSEENIGVDIEVSSVNPYILEANWYEKIGLHADVGVGNGLLIGVGASYKIGKFTIGPTAWGAINWDLQPKGYLGATFGWNPFQRD
jgi:hypothetical protein